MSVKQLFREKLDSLLEAIEEYKDQLAEQEGGDDDDDDDWDDEDYGDLEEKALVGKQHKLDKNKNGKLDSQDFKMLRGEVKEGYREDKKEAPFAGPHRRTSEVRKDKFGNVVKNRAKHLAKKGMASVQKEEVDQIDEVTPPGREKQVKALKKTGVRNPWAVAWASYNKSKKK